MTTMCPTRAPTSEMTELPPGPSVRLRTAAELTAAIRDQVEDSEYCIHSSLQAHEFANRIELIHVLEVVS